MDLELLSQVAIGIIVFFIILIVSNRIFFIKYSHKWRIKSSLKALEKIKTFENNGQIFSYLRKIDPFAMEELILHAIANNKEVKIIRNKRYTGDGGVDGKFTFQNKLFLIQVKRYSSYITKKQIEEFSNQIKLNKAYKGFFIHTGKTSQDILSFVKNEHLNMEIISGEKLIGLIKFGKINVL